MEFRRRSLWNRVWEGEGLDIMGQEEYVRRIYVDEGSQVDQWREIGYGLVLSAWKGVQWAWRGLGLNRLWYENRRDSDEHDERDEHERQEDQV